MIKSARQIFKVDFLEFSRYFSIKKNLLDMNQVYFKYHKEELADKIMISLRIQKEVSETKKVDKNFNFVRNLNEKVDTTLNRIKNNVEKEINVKTKKSKGNKANNPEPVEKINQEVRLLII